MVQKIFSGEKPLWLCDTMSPALIKTSEDVNCIVYTDQIPDFRQLFETLKDEKYVCAIVKHYDFKKLKKSFLKTFKVIEAAGGIVQNEKKELLFIFRRQKWDLPKGKMEKGESVESCAAREIEEETGVKNLRFKEMITDTCHIYEEKGKTLVKLSHWFWFTCSGKQNLLAQTAEEITEVKWIPTKQIKEPMTNTYESIRDVVNAFFEKP